MGALMTGAGLFSLLQTPLLALALGPLAGDFTSINVAFALLEVPLLMGVMYMRSRVKQASAAGDAVGDTPVVSSGRPGSIN